MVYVQNKFHNNRRTLMVCVAIPIVFAFYGYVPTLLNVGQNDPMLALFPPFAFHTNDADHKHLGAEYWNIAQSLVKNRGFSSPFGIESGPTAWMPPLLPMLLAAIYSVTGHSVDLTVDIFVALNCVIFAWVASDVARWTLKNRNNNFAIVPISIALVFIGNFRDNFQLTHDGTIQLAIAHWMCRLVIDFECWKFWTWGIVGGIASLASPAITLTWIVVSVVLLCEQRRAISRESRTGSSDETSSIHRPLNRHVWKKFILAGCISLAIQTPWLVRNTYVFKTFIPIKSNGLFELEQSLLRDDDGVLDFSKNLHHPYMDNEEGKKHADMGEIAYVRERVDQLNDNFFVYRWKYLDDCCDRIISILFLYYPTMGFAHANTWVFINVVLYALPWTVFLSSLLFSERLPREQWIVLFLFAAYTVPYILLSYYSRYMIPMMGIRCLILIWGIQRWSEWHSRYNAASRPSVTAEL